MAAGLDGEPCWFEPHCWVSWRALEVKSSISEINCSVSKSAVSTLFKLTKSSLSTWKRGSIKIDTFDYELKIVLPTIFTWESQSNPGIEIWLDALEPLLQGTVVDMEQVSGSHEDLNPASFLFKVSWDAAAATSASERRKIDWVMHFIFSKTDVKNYYQYPYYVSKKTF